MKEYDLIVIGSGVGLSVLSQGLSRGQSCALIEVSKMGGTCLTRGCIPSKVLVYPADVIRQTEKATKIGLSIKIDKPNWEHISDRMWEQINESNQIDEKLSQAPNLDIYKGVGEFVSNFKMRVKLKETGLYSDTFKGKKIIIGAGGRSIEPPIPGLKEARYITSETFFGDKFPSKPWDSLIIIGGGIIAAEFAHIFSAMGTKVTIIEMLPRLVSTEESEISSILEKNMENYLTVKTNSKAVGVRLEDSAKCVVIENTETKVEEEIFAEEILVATGRRPNTDILKIENTEIEINNQGWIETNKYLETSVENIWAIGDINGKFQFRHKANHDADVCVQNVFGGGQKIPVDYTAVPWAIYTWPQIAHVGITEQEAIEQGHKIMVAKKNYGSVAKGYAMGLENDPKEGLFKMIVDENYRILGAHIIGPHAAILIQPFVFLMNSGFKCDESKREMPLKLLKKSYACPDAGTFMPIYQSMIIHPSLNEVTGWALGNLKPVNMDPHKHNHQ